MTWANLTGDVVLTAEIMRLPFLLWLGLTCLSLVLSRFPGTRVAGAYLGFSVTGALALSVVLALIALWIGTWWLDANPELSVGNDGAGLLVGMAWFAALPTGGVLGLLLGVMYARKATNRQRLF